MASTGRQKEHYQRLLATENELPLFFQSWWLDAICGQNHWDVKLSLDKGKNIRGCLPFFRQKMKGFSVLSNPPFTPYLGPYIIYPDNPQSRVSLYSFENKVLKELAEQLPREVSYMDFSCVPALKNWYPFYWQGFEQTTRYTYVLSDIKKHDKTYEGFSNTLKKQIRSCDRMTTRTSDDYMTLFKFLEQNHKKQGLKVPVSANEFGSLCKSVLNRQQGHILEVIDKEQQVLASMLLVWDIKTAYALVIGMDESMEKNNAVKLLLWESIKLASEYVENYNFEGSMIRNVERVFRSFGGVRTPYYKIKWYRNTWIKAGFSLFKK